MKNNLHLIDCMDFMKDKPDNYYDLAIVDPEYGIEINHNIGRRKGDKHSGHKKVTWDKKPPDDIYFSELFRVSRDQIIWGGNYFSQIWSKGCKGFVIWDKLFSEKVSFSMYEFAWTSFDIVSKGFKYSPQNDKDKIHPTQKPVSLYKWLLTNYAKPGDKILDTHSGSGSLRIACHDLGFDIDSCEIDPDYYRDNQARFKKHTQQNELFDTIEYQDIIFKEKEND